MEKLHTFYEKIKIHFQNSDLSFDRKRQTIRNEGQLSNIVREFCESTSLHGFNFLYNAKSLTVRLLWIFSILVMMGFGAFFLVKNTNAYLKSKLRTSTDSSSSYLDVSSFYGQTNQVEKKVSAFHRFFRKSSIPSKGFNKSFNSTIRLP